MTDYMRMIKDYEDRIHNEPCELYEEESGYEPTYEELLADGEYPEN